ncbi:MAG TPA: transcriptional repressor [Patescibacteria group bacterium]|jgi:Fur family peroxide stress response transcriptional regulator|nr:transcriptional repressor [Patescibacteria group bacterium]
MIPKKDSLAAFEAACRAGGLSVTHQRLAVYEAVLTSRSHPGAEEIYRTVRKRFPTISRGTVYRTLETLCGIGLVTDVHQTADTARFEAVLEPHHHLVCLGCRAIVDLYDDSLRRVPARAGRKAQTAGFEVTGYQIQFVGYCRDCSKGVRSRPHQKEEHHGQGA